ncbi:MAG: quinone-dependent dihydroorotate dehydrogenase [Bryobacter sp.]|nr:quinone-dependent dihydroorotate dehydrogenase [Bryobacter sp.]
MLRPLLFRSDPERMHDRAIRVAELASGSPLLCDALHRTLGFDDPALRVEAAGLRFPHPIGLAAGFDKNGRAIPFWEALGFSHIEIGSISAEFSAGNPKPRLFRAVADRGIVVHYGLPNDGAERVARRLAAVTPRLATPLGVNLVNTNRGTGAPAAGDDEIIADYARSFQLLEPHAGYLCLNLSCPNTCDGRAFISDPHRVRALLETIGQLRPAKPVFLKVAPFAGEAALDSFLETVHGFAFVSGFSINLPPGKPPGMRTPAELLNRMPGAVSGKPAEAAANRAIAQLYERIDPRRFLIIGSGGVFTAEDVWHKMELGATLVQCLTGLIYEGPVWVHRLCEQLSAIAARHGVKNIREVVGSAHRR